MNSFSIKPNELIIYSHPQKLLKDHLKGVIEGTQVKTENKLAKLAAFFHDLGKINPNFQIKLSGVKVKGYSQHAFLSAYIFHVFYYENYELIDELIENKQERIIALKALIAKHHGDLPNFTKNFIDNNKENCKNPYKQLKEFILNGEELPAFEYLNEVRELIGFPLLKEDSIKEESSLEMFQKCFSGFAEFPASEDDTSLEIIWDKLDFFLETQFAFGLLLDADKRDASGNNLDKNIKQKEQIKFFNNFSSKLTQKLNNLTPKKTIDYLRTDMREASVKALQEKMQLYPEQRVFTLTAPTGAGKTFMLLALTQEILKHNNDLGIIYSLPFLSITEQVEEICQKVFGSKWVSRIDSKSNNKIINEIQKQLDEDQSELKLQELIKEKYSEKTFEKPFIITTFVQFFETLLSNKNSVCMRLPNFANRIFLIDEIQALPPNLYTFLIAYLDTFCKKFNCYAIVSTATMPSFKIASSNTKAKELFKNFDESIIQNSELLGENYFQASEFDRYFIESKGELEINSLAELVQTKNDSCLIILNTIADTESLWDLLKETENTKVILLNTHFILSDRKKKIRYARRLLKWQKKQKVILISTQLIEAGVDISFPIVFRDLCPLPNLIQSSGRCNRSNEYTKGQIVFFALKDEKGKLSAKKIYRDQWERQYLDWTLNLMKSEIITEKELFSKQQEYFVQIALKRQTGLYKKIDLVKHINNLAFEDLGKFKLIEEEIFGEEYKYYVPSSNQEGEKQYQEISDLLTEYASIKRNDFSQKERLQTQLDSVKKQIENKTVSFRLNSNKFHNLPEHKPKPLLGIYWLNNLSQYKANEKGIQLENGIDDRDFARVKVEKII